MKTIANSTILTLILFTYQTKAGTWTLLDAPGATRTHIMDIDGDNLVGFYKDNLRWHGFLYNMTTQDWTILDAPGVGVGQATHIDGVDGNKIVGYFGRDGVDISSFTYNINTEVWTIFNEPKGNDTRAHGIDGDNIVGVYYENDPVTGYINACYGFIYDGSIWSTPNTQSQYSGFTGIDGFNVIGDTSYGGILYNTDDLPPFIVPSLFGVSSVC